MLLRPKVVAHGLVMLAVFSTCSSGGGGVKGDCYLPSDCRPGLTCLFKRCHVICQADPDCLESRSYCRTLEPDVTACLLDDEIACAPGSNTCPGLTSCGVDLTCRNGCTPDVTGALVAACLPGQTCVQDFCAGPSELNDAGLLPTIACQYHSDCPVLMRCRDQVCRKECRLEGDCAFGERCTQDRLCARPGESAAPPPDSGVFLPDSGYGDVCRADFECKPGLQCLTSRCGLPCFANGDCGAAGCCRANQCVASSLCSAVTLDAGRCATTQDCSTGWCDDGLCAPSCLSNGDCTGARTCDPSTRTCVTPCNGMQCPNGEACDGTLCRRVCGGPLLCDPGFKCNAASRCVPECANRADCPAHRNCQSGACVFDGTCDVDVDCPAGTICIDTSCQPRPNALADGGGFACPNGPCDCRSGEVCDDGRCVFDILPNRFVAADGGGTGLSTASPASSFATMFTPDASVVVAVRANDAFTGQLSFTAAGQGLLGGYVHCPSTNRWVRDLSAHSQLSAGTFEVVRVPGTLTRPLPNVTVGGFELLAGAPCTQAEAAVLGASYAPGLAVRQLSGSFSALPTCTSTDLAIVRAVDSSGVRIDDVTVAASALVNPSTQRLHGVDVRRGSGLVRRVAVPAQAVNAFSAVHVLGATGPLEVRELEVGQLNSTGSAKTRLVWLRDTLAPLAVRRCHLVLAAGNAIQTAGIVTEGCGQVLIEDNHVDGALHPGPLPQATSAGEDIVGISLVDSAGAVLRNRIDLPSSSVTNYAGETVGIGLTGPNAAFDIGFDTVNAPRPPGVVRGYRVRDVLRSGPISLHDLTLDGGVSPSAQSIVGIDVEDVPAYAGLRITDVDLTAPVNVSTCSGTIALRFTSSAAVIERARAVGRGGAAFQGLKATGSRLELYSSLLLAGPTGSNCNLGILEVEVSGVVTGAGLFAAGNTVEVASDSMSTATMSALTCNSAVELFASSNLFGAGSGFNASMVRGTAACFVPQRFDHNYFWYTRPAGRVSGENVGLITASDGGVPDALGNVVGDNVNPFGATAAPGTYVLPAGSPCIDRGQVGTRVDGTTVDRDVDRRPRVNGAAADIGAYER